MVDGEPQLRDHRHAGHQNAILEATIENGAHATEQVTRDCHFVNNAGGPPPGDFRDWSRED